MIMFLSYLLVDTGENPDRPRPGRLWLRNPYRVHQRLCMAFPSREKKAADPLFLQPYDGGSFAKGQVHVEREREKGFLFRVDPLPNGRAVVVVQSAVRPDWEYAFRNARFLLAAPPEISPFDPRFSEGEELRFRLLANPIRRLSPRSRGPDGNPVKSGVGKRVPVPEERLVDWLVKKGENGGFSLRAESLVLVPGYVRAYKGREEKKRISLRSCLFEGTLVVTEPDRFSETIVRGIGPAKGLGFGLLSVLR